MLLAVSNKVLKKLKKLFGVTAPAEGKVYVSGSQTVRRDAPVRRFSIPRASRDNLI